MNEIYEDARNPKFLFRKLARLYDQNPGDPQLEWIEKAINRCGYKIGLRYLLKDEDDPDSTECIEELYLLDPEGEEIDNASFEIPQNHQIHAAPDIKSFTEIMGELRVIW